MTKLEYMQDLERQLSKAQQRSAALQAEIARLRSAVVIHDGDTVILEAGDTLTVEDVVSMRSQCESVAPGTHIIILSGGLRVARVGAPPEPGSET